MTDLSKLKRLAKAVEGEEWHFERSPVHSDPDYVAQGAYLGSTMITLGDTYDGYRDHVDFIEASDPSTILELIARIEALESGRHE